MKKMIKNGFVAAAIMLAAVVNVSGAELPVKVSVTGEKAIGLFINDITERVWIVLRDNEGQVIYSKVVKNRDSYAVEYDLHNLPDGAYMVDFENNDQRKRLNFVIENGKVVISRAGMQVMNTKK